MLSYIIVFLEGIVTFISPCLLPMLPLYVGYFMGAGGENSRGGVLRRAFGFILGFTILFVLMGAFAGTIGSFFIRYATAVNIIGGGIILLLGLVYLGVLNIPLFKGIRSRWRGGGFWMSLLMGIIFAVSWTPCVGAFLGSALVLASQSGGVVQGSLMLLLYSLGLGLPFVLGAVLLEKLKTVFDWLKNHGQAVSRVSGGLLLLLGLLMMTGLLGKLLNLMT